MPKHIYLISIITMWITMFPSENALIGPAPHVTALPASIQPSQPIRQEPSETVNSAAKEAALDHI